MGKGKGEPEYWAAVVRPGMVLYEIGGVSEEAARLCFACLAHKMPVHTNTSVANTFQLDVDTRARKRYLLLTVTPFTTKTVTSWVSYQHAELSPTPATTFGLMGRASA